MPSSTRSSTASGSDEEPLLPATVEQRIAAGLMAAAALLAATAGVFGGAPLAFAVCFWFAAMALGLWRVRPAPGRERGFRGWYAALLPLAVLLALISYRWAGAVVTGERASLKDPSLDVLEGLALLCMFLAWVPALVLVRFGRRPGLLLISVTVVPVLLFGMMEVLGGPS